MERKKWEDASEAGPATMTSRAIFAFMFASTFALSLFALTSTFVRGLTLAFTFGNVWIWRIEVSYIPGEEGVGCCPWSGRTKRSSAWSADRFNSSLRYPRGITYGNEFCKKGVRIPPRGAAARRGVQNIRRRGNGSSNGLRSGSSGRKGRRDRDSWREGARGEAVLVHVGKRVQRELEGEEDHMEGVDVGILARLNCWTAVCKAWVP